MATIDTTPGRQGQGRGFGALGRWCDEDRERAAYREPISTLTRSFLDKDELRVVPDHRAEGSAILRTNNSELVAMPKRPAER